MYALMPVPPDPCNRHVVLATRSPGTGAAEDPTTRGCHVKNPHVDRSTALPAVLRSIAVNQGLLSNLIMRNFIGGYRGFALGF